MFDFTKEPEPTFGFKFCYVTEGKEFLDVMINNDLDPCCMIRPITIALFDQINEERRLGRPNVKKLPFVNVGQFLLTFGSCQSDSGISFYGPFDSLIDAQDFAKENLDVNYFYQYSDPNFCLSYDETLPETV